MPTHRESVLRKLGLPLNEQLSLRELSIYTGVPLRAVEEVRNRGVGAWKTNPESVRLKGSFAKNPDMGRYPRSARLTKEQWSMARVYSFLDKGRTFYTADADIAREYGLASM
jgi:hypothetical protein